MRERPLVADRQDLLSTPISYLNASPTSRLNDDFMATMNGIHGREAASLIRGFLLSEVGLKKAESEPGIMF